MTIGFDDILAISPEISLIIISSLALIAGVFLKNKQAEWVNFICMSGLAVSLIMNNSLFASLGTYFNSTYSISYYSIFTKNIIVLCSLVIMMMLNKSLTDESEYLKFEVSVLITLSTTGMMLLQSAESLIMFYISLELLSLPLYILAAINRSNLKSSEAGLKYFVLGSLSSCLLLFGASLVYASSAFFHYFDATLLNFTDIRELLEVLNKEKAIQLTSFNPWQSIILEIGLLFMLAALCFKVAAVPFHMWAPDVYQGSPTIITAFFSAAPKAAAAFFLMKLYYGVLSYSTIINFSGILTTVFLFSMVIGSLAAMRQDDIKRLLAYSSIGHVGFGLIAFSVALLTTAQENRIDQLIGFAASTLYLVVYLTMTLTIFACILILKRNGKNIEKITDLTMLSKYHPSIAFAMALILFSMAGIPPMAGFFAKFTVLETIILSQSYYISIVYVLFSVIAAYYYLKVIKVIYFDETKDIIEIHNSRGMRLIILAGVIFNFFFIVFWSDISNYINNNLSNYLGDYQITKLLTEIR